MITRGVISLAAFVVLSACETSTGGEDVTRFSPEYRGIETQLLDGDLVNFRVAMSGARSAQDIDAYAAWVAKQA